MCQDQCFAGPFRERQGNGSQISPSLNLLDFQPAAGAARKIGILMLPGFRDEGAALLLPGSEGSGNTDQGVLHYWFFVVKTSKKNRKMCFSKNQ